MNNDKLDLNFDIKRTPHDIQSGWLPTSLNILSKFHKGIHETPKTEYSPSVKKLADFIEKNEVIKYLFQDACNKNANLIESKKKNLEDPDNVPIPRIKDIDTFLHGFNTMLKYPPSFIDDELVGLPFSAWVVGIDPTLSGVALFSLPMINERIAEILNEWFEYLNLPDSGNKLFGKEGEQWLSDKAKKQYRFDDWKKDSETLPYWKSWNSFFTREFKDREKQRPVTAPESDEIVCSANDGSLFCWSSNVSTKDVYWFKDMRYSIGDILSSSKKEQQDVFEQYDLVNLFKNGYVLQTFLNPYNFHRWWVPVNGEVLFDPVIIPGYYYNKIIIPDYEGAETASLPYSAQVNARGLIVIKTESYGYVACIPLGMGEVSSISFNEKMKKGAKVKKGDEMGMFQYGGSSFVLIFQNLPNKKLLFINDKGDLLPERPLLPQGSAEDGGVTINIGSKIAQWITI